MKPLFKSFLLFTCIIFTFSSCYKEEETTLRVTVKDRQGNGTEGVVVNVTGGVSVNQTKTSGSNGVAVFDLSTYYNNGQSGLFILNVDLDNDSDRLNPNLINGYETVEIEPNKENKATIYFDLVY